MTKGAERAAGIPQTLDDQQVKRLKEKAAGGGGRIGRNGFRNLTVEPNKT